MKNPGDVFLSTVSEKRQSGIKKGSEEDLGKVELVNQLDQLIRKRRNDPVVGDKRIPTDAMNYNIPKSFQELHHKNDYKL